MLTNLKLIYCYRKNLVSSGIWLSLISRTNWTALTVKIRLTARNVSLLILGESSFPHSLEHGGLESDAASA